MIRRRLIRLLALVCLATSAVVALVPTPSSAESPEATGWWSRSIPFQGSVEGNDVEGLSSREAVRFNTAAAPGQELPEPTVPVPTTTPGQGPVTTLPSPVPVPTVPPLPIPLPEDLDPGTPNPTVPDGGLWVANDATGPVAMSAIRYKGDIGAGELALTFAPGSTTAGPLVACPALSSFDPDSHAWNDRPAHDCDRIAMSGRLNSDATQVHFTIPQGFLPFGERVLDVLILPDLERGDVFSVNFEAPGPDSLDISQGQELPPAVSELPEPDPLTLPTSPEFSGSSDFGDDFTDLPVEQVAAPESADESSSPEVPTPIAQILEPITESRWARIISVAVLLAMAAGLWLFGGQPVRHPRLLGALAGDAPAVVDQPSTGRGIGRFRRDRLQLPGRL